MQHKDRCGLVVRNRGSRNRPKKYGQPNGGGYPLFRILPRQCLVFASVLHVSYFNRCAVILHFHLHVGIQLFQCPLLKILFFPLNYLSLCQKSIDHNYVGLFPHCILFSLIQMSVLSQMSYYLDYCSFKVWNQLGIIPLIMFFFLACILPILVFFFFFFALLWKF